MYRVGVLTASDKGSRGEREDISGPLIADKVTEIGGQVEQYVVLADDRDLIADRLKQWCDQLCLDLILTTGGTGFALRDVTPEATMDIVERLVPGIPEFMRAQSMNITPRAMLSRAVAGIRGRTLIINLPGSPKAVTENLNWILPTLPHGLDILKGTTGECANDRA